MAVRGAGTLVSRGRALLVAASAATASLAAAGCEALPGYENEVDATLVNESGVEVTTFWSDSPTGHRARDLTTAPGDSAQLPVGGECKTGWWVEREAGNPVEIGELCPGDEVTVTRNGLEQHR